tara:strand:+ start:2859 stop:3188 length:330 start_codon:yes stop_codon:yes gene_type:complete
MKVNKPWGHEIRWAITENYLGKILFIKRGMRLSKQYHEVKDESIYVLAGVLQLEVDDETIILKEGQSYRIKPGVVHRFCAPIDCSVRLVEVSTGEIEDVVRLEDDYGRS